LATAEQSAQRVSGRPVLSEIVSTRAWLPSFCATLRDSGDAGALDAGGLLRWGGGVISRIDLLDR
jgi:hypothetical protein